MMNGSDGLWPVTRAARAPGCSSVRAVHTRGGREPGLGLLGAPRSQLEGGSVRFSFEMALAPGSFALKLKYAERTGSKDDFLKTLLNYS